MVKQSFIRRDFTLVTVSPCYLFIYLGKWMEPMDGVTHNDGILHADFIHCLSSLSACPHVLELPVCYVVLLAAHDSVIVRAVDTNRRNVPCTGPM
jgi:hypothetical protein